MYTRFCLRVNYFVENILKIKSFAAKITLLYFLVFIVSLIISSLILGLYQLEKDFKYAKQHIKLAVDMRQALSQEKLEIYQYKLEKLLRNNLLEEIEKDQNIKTLNEVSVLKNKEYFYKNGIIYVPININEKNYIVGIDEKLLYDVIIPKAGIVSVYKPHFYISSLSNPEADSICSFKKYDSSNFYLIGCIDKNTVLKMSLARILEISTVFAVSFTSIILISFFTIKSIILFPLNFLMFKLQKIKVKGLENVKFNLQKFGKDELTKVSALLEDFRITIVKSNHKFKLIFETITKMISVSNDFNNFAYYILNRLDKILSLEGSLILSRSKLNRNTIVYSDKFQMKQPIINIKEVEEKLTTEDIFNEKEDGYYKIYIKKKVDEDLELVFIGISKEELNKEDKDYLNAILSNFSYIIKIYNLANVDFLTKIPNRRKVMSDFEKELKMAEMYKKDLSIAMIDIDDFKIINDTYGHDAGDRILIQVVEIIKNSIRSQDILGRYGGEEFLLIMPETSFKDALNVVERLRKNLEYSDIYIIENIKASISVSIGLANTEIHGYEPEFLLKAADLGLYKAKREGKNRVEFLTKEEIENVIKKDFESKNIILKAIREDRIVPFFQPIVKADTLEISGYEVLARLYVPEENKYISAFSFISDMIKYRFIEKIDKIVQQKAINYLSEINQKDSKFLLFMNMSKDFFENSKNLDELIKLLNLYKVKPENIYLEITEEEALHDLENIKEHIMYGKSLGLNFAIDDFGAGYSNFIYLKHLPVDLLKIDGSLISNINEDLDKQVIVESIVRIAKYKKIKVLAEMVEKEEEYKFLKELGVDYLQGYFFGRPSPTLLN
jgi:diguanylate cyclase (GGDEF)-like protein